MSAQHNFVFTRTSYRFSNRIFIEDVFYISYCKQSGDKTDLSDPSAVFRHKSQLMQIYCSYILYVPITYGGVIDRITLENFNLFSLAYK